MVSSRDFVVPVRAAAPALDGLTLRFEAVPIRRRSLWLRPLELLHRHSISAFALLFLLVGSSAIQVAGAYQAAQITLDTSIPTLSIPATPLRGPNLAVASADYPSRSRALPISQSASPSATKL